MATVGKRFVLTAEHVLLLRNAVVSWQFDENGAPCVDPKRPYGNSNLTRDLVRVLGLPADEEGYPLDPDNEVRLHVLHEETETALQVVLGTGSFEPGDFARVSNFSRDWRRVTRDWSPV